MSGTTQTNSGISRVRRLPPNPQVPTLALNHSNQQPGILYLPPNYLLSTLLEADGNSGQSSVLEAAHIFLRPAEDTSILEACISSIPTSVSYNRRYGGIPHSNLGSQFDLALRIGDVQHGTYTSHVLPSGYTWGVVELPYGDTIRDWAEYEDDATLKSTLFSMGRRDEGDLHARNTLAELFGPEGVEVEFWPLRPDETEEEVLSGLDQRPHKKLLNMSGVLEVTVNLISGYATSATDVEAQLEDSHISGGSS
ncbi:hypothetical protein TREMEDRAFT_61622 [Tremella mesenterica DSM 1558]|uniref:uncharacterized protein n=1 Tax=Tremella mesenterica (strain ATCC 24925 / CBS 8224 / DSM 1558 / NBRC 9311 / NRRL Y-6157 / RJB 2259-6 / UBC 559-6) TaxID=578456 RepID=UPI0003F4A594|nr:uncharacterized protein TREMEDRAFT_61622 [Tremella mesenterica DSM 1558]EIW69851.1 hypothetical protein TREMEDRAFT_61622 [Tremella mesenterica DSM 1558]